jgi:uncharacterized membrane protein YjjB (DUF3815 family)
MAQQLMQLAVQVGAAFLGTLSFAILFNVPRKHVFSCGITGAVGWFFYQITMMVASSTGVATFVATVVLCAMSRLLSVRRRTPTTIFLVCGIFTLVPGASIYYTAYDLFMGYNQEAMTQGLNTVRLALAIALGISVVYSLPPSLFGWKEQSPSEKAQPDEH